MKYFLHYTNAMQDEKITRLFIEFGYAGTGLFFAILERFADTESPIFEDILKYQLKIKGKKLTKIYEFLIEIELIFSQKSEQNENKIEVFNENILKSAKKYQKNNENAKKRVTQWRERQADKENVTHNKYVRNADVTLVNKIKINKIKENKDNTKNQIDFSLLFDFFKNEFKEIWIKEFIPLKKKKRGAITERALTQQLNKIKTLSGGDYYSAKQILENTVNSGWTDFYELKTNGKTLHKINKDIQNDPNRMKF